MRSLLLGLLVVLSSQAGCSVVEKTPVVSKVDAAPGVDAQADAPYEVSIDGRATPVLLGTHDGKTYYVRYSIDQPAEVVVAGEGLENREIIRKPGFPIRKTRASGGRARLPIPPLAPQVLLVSGRPPLFFLPESPRGEFEVSDSPTVHVDPGSDPESHTELLQETLDATFEAGGGTVVLNPGVHPTRALRIRSNTTLHLRRGSVLKAAGSPGDYVSDLGGRALVVVDNATDAAIRGHGVIDGSGHILQKRHNSKAHLVNAIGCRNLVVEGVVLRDPPGWTLHLLGCEGVRVSGISILGDWGLSNTDGIDPDMSRDVVIEDCFIHSGDDAIAIKTTGQRGIVGAVERVVARRCVVMTMKTALKIGTESRYDIRDVRFEDIDVVDSSRGCALWMRDGGTYADITFEDVRLERLLRMPGEPWSGQAYHVSIQKRYGRGVMRDIVFRRVSARSEWKSDIFSNLDYPVSGVDFEDCVWRSDTEEAPRVELRNAAGVRFIGCEVETPVGVRPFSAEMLDGPSAGAVSID